MQDSLLPISVRRYICPYPTVIEPYPQNGIFRCYWILYCDHGWKENRNDVTALMEISLEHPRYNELFIENIKKNPNIISCYYLTGEFDYLLKIACQSSDIWSRSTTGIKDQGGVRRPYTLCPSEPKEIFILLCRKQKSNNRKGFLWKKQNASLHLRVLWSWSLCICLLFYFHLWTAIWHMDYLVHLSHAHLSSPVVSYACISSLQTQP